MIAGCGHHLCVHFEERKGELRYELLDVVGFFVWQNEGKERTGCGVDGRRESKGPSFRSLNDSPLILSLGF